MGAGRFVKLAEKPGMKNAWGSLSRGDCCSCHPRAWGLKKGLRRARRRLDGETVLSDSVAPNEAARGHRSTTTTATD